MTTASGDFDLTQDELRIVANYALQAAEMVLPYFEDACPDDPRPRAAIEAAREFVRGKNRSKLQRVASVEAHRAAKDATSEVSRLAAQAAGDAASAAYLHPIAKATQVGHILRAAASEVRIIEIGSLDDPAATENQIKASVRRATPTLREVLLRYPHAPQGKSRVAQLMVDIDLRLREPH